MRLIDLRLARGIGQVIVAADDMGDAHVVVVDHDRQIIGRRAVAAQDDEIVEVLVGEDDAALHPVLDHRLALARRLEADRGHDAGRRLCQVAVAPGAVIAGRAAFGARPLAHGGELFRGSHSSDRPCLRRAAARPPRGDARARAS